MEYPPEGRRHAHRPSCSSPPCGGGERTERRCSHNSRSQATYSMGCQCGRPECKEAWLERPARPRRLQQVPDPPPAHKTTASTDKPASDKSAYSKGPTCHCSGECNRRPCTDSDGYTGTPPTSAEPPVAAPPYPQRAQRRMFRHMRSSAALGRIFLLSSTRLRSPLRLPHFVSPICRSLPEEIALWVTVRSE